MWVLPNFMLLYIRDFAICGSWHLWEGQWNHPPTNTGWPCPLPSPNSPFDAEIRLTVDWWQQHWSGCASEETKRALSFSTANSTKMLTGALKKTKQPWWAVESVRRFLSVSHTYTHTLWKIICGFPKGHNQLITILKSCWINRIGILFALQENCCGCCCFEKASGKISSSGSLTPVMTGSQSPGSLELELGEALLGSVGDPGGSLGARADAHTPLSTQRGRCCSDFLTFCVWMFVCSFGC